MAKYIPENARWVDITPLLNEIDSGLKHMRFYDERDDYSDFLAEEREDLLRLRNDEVYVMQTSSPKREGPAEFTCSMPEQKHYLKNILYKIVEKLNSLIGLILDEFDDD